MASKTKWFIYTVLIGITPVLIRLIIALIASKPAPLFNAGNIISFGLVLVITNINLLEHQTGLPVSWKTANIGISLVLSVLFVVLFAVMCINDIDQNIVDLKKIKIASAILDVAAFILSYAVVDRISKYNIGGTP